MPNWNLEAAAGAPGTSFLWRGTWSSALSYNVNDGVMASNGSGYVALTNNANKEPSANPSHWSMFAAGGNAYTTTTANFDVPAVGDTVNVTLEDASWITLGQTVVVETAGGSPTDAHSFEVIAKSGNQVTLENTAADVAGDMDKSIYDANSNDIVDLAEAVPWAGVTGKPTTFAPSAHASAHLDNGADAISVATTSRTGLAPIRSGTATTFLDGTGVYSTPVPAATTLNPAFVPLTDATTVTWTVVATQVTQNAKVTIAGNRTLAFSGIAAGMNGTLIVTQGTGGSRTLALPSGSKVINGGAGLVALSTAVGAIDILSWIYDGTNYFWTLGKNYT